MSPLTLLLLIANVLIFGLELALGGAIIRPLELWPLGPHFAPWQLVTYAFLHGGLGHLASNMFGLWMFGTAVERAIGGVRFAQLYFTSLVTAALTQLGIAYFTGAAEPTVGASGAIFGILAAFAVLFPKQVIMLIFPPIPLPAPIFVAIYAAYELFSGVAGLQVGVAHYAHLGGLVGGYWAIHHRVRQRRQQRWELGG